ncbi:MAG: hypothetical protein GX638_14610 [Crenarchaeota archaeon]|nr:hypothetical protein [Thermoproteota archaeon]
MLFLGLLFGVCILIGIILIIYSNKTTKSQVSNINSEKVVNIKNLFQANKIYHGAIEHLGQYLLLARIEGMNFSVMSEIEQNARESALIDIFSRLDFPIRFITNTCVVDTSNEARKIAEIADTENQNLQTYRILYTGALEQMRLERSVLTQQNFIIIPGENPEEAHHRFNILSSSLRERTSIIITLLETTEDIYDALQDILTPEKIIKPSDVVQSGVLEPVHFSVREVATFAEKLIQKEA